MPRNIETTKSFLMLTMTTRWAGRQTALTPCVLHLAEASVPFPACLICPFVLTTLSACMMLSVSSAVVGSGVLSVLLIKVSAPMMVFLTRLDGMAWPCKRWTHSSVSRWYLMSSAACSRSPSGRGRADAQFAVISNLRNLRSSVLAAQFIGTDGTDSRDSYPATIFVRVIYDLSKYEASSIIALTQLRTRTRIGNGCSMRQSSPCF